MNLSRTIFLGWYYILDKTIYSMNTEGDGIGPRHHSFFITFLLHGINIWSIIRYAMATIFEARVPFYIALTLGLVVLLIGYLTFYAKNTKKIITRDFSTSRIVLLSIVAFGYAVISVHGMIVVGNFVKDKLAY